MRILETAMIVACLLSLISVGVRRVRALRWPTLVVPAAVLITVLQVLLEGPRWQLAGCYLLIMIIGLVRLADLLRPGRRRPRPGLGRVGVAAGVPMIIVTVLLAAVMPVFSFREPTGPYAIGTVAQHWIDTDRDELFTTDPDDHRELMAQIWYPAEPQPAKPRAPYIEDADVVGPAIAKLFGLPAAMFSQLEQVRGHAVAGAPIATDRPDRPVLISLTGLNGFRAGSTFQIEELVSRGYIVVGLDQPGSAAVTRFPDGRQIPVLPREEMYPLVSQSWWPEPEPPTFNGERLPDGIIPYFAGDVSFALDRLAKINEKDPSGILTGRIDLDRAGVFGISWGGAVAGQACADDRRLKACLIMDVQQTADVVRKGLGRPTMFLTRDADTIRLERERVGGWPEREVISTLQTMTEVYERLPVPGYYVEVPGLFHVDFTDTPLLTPAARKLGLNGTIDPHRAHDIINAYTVAFFDKHLRGADPALLQGESDDFPEARLKQHPGR